uniref:Uncharacterized protein n=1 Tax=Anguilla anguilla TaxID=7936 RepID=A0A0E9UKE4_ANGAN
MKIYYQQPTKWARGQSNGSLSLQSPPSPCGSFSE